MGDVGALALGAALGVVAVIVRQEIVLADHGRCVCDGNPVGDLCRSPLSSSPASVFSAWRHLHHHYELKGWPEPRVIVRFWIITVMLVLFGLATLKLR